MTQTEIAQNLSRGMLDFSFFLVEIFARSFDDFTDGYYIKRVGDYYQRYRNTARISARDHFKSTGLYAQFMQALLKDSHTGSENHYFSYQEGMSKYHIAKIKELVRRNPYFQGIHDKKGPAEGVIMYYWLDDYGEPLPYITLEPHGLLSFKRGIHCKRVYVDDPLRDPENKLNPTVIEKVNRIIFTEILDMPHKDNGECHIVGTPQTWQDFFFDPRMKLKFKVWIQPAIISEAEQKVIWPEWRDFAELCRRRDLRGVKIFNQEYMCKPVYAENSYFEEQQLFDVINSDLKNWALNEEWDEEFENKLKTYDVVGGWDLGKKAHPSHFAIFLHDAQQNKDIQIHQAFFDNWDYFRQLEYTDKAIKKFHINELSYDATRGELEGFKEQDMLSGVYRPVVFSQKTKNGMASSLQKKVNGTKIKEENGERIVTDRRVELIDDSRQINQILAVDNDLDAMASPEGHGDAFWSIAMALREKGYGRAFTSKPEGF